MAPVSREFLISLGIERIINYIRKSRADEEYEKKTGEDVLQAQKELMDRVLEPLDMPFDQRFEVGSGDKISTRPVFQSVINDLQTGTYQLIAVKEISRMGRGSYTDMGIIYDLIVDNRIYVMTPYRLYDPKNPDDLRQIRFELFMSREEFETTRQRLFGGRVSNAMQGKWVAGAAPYGFDYNSLTGRLEINEDQAKVIRAIFDLYVNGVPDENGIRRDVSFRALSTYLERHTPYTTPKGKRHWNPTYLRDFLSTERFIGIIKFRTTKRVDGKIVKLPEEEHIIAYVEPILDQAVWDAAQAKIAASGNKPRVKMDFTPTELAGLCTCAICGKKMIRQYSVQNYQTKSGSVTTYHKEFLWCHTLGCTFVKYRSVEEDLLSILKYMIDLEDDVLRNRVVDMVAKQKKPTTRVDIDQTEYIEQRMKELKNRARFIYEKYESQKYTDEVFDERMAEVNKEIEHLNEMSKSVVIKSPEDLAKEIDLSVVRTNIRNVLDAYNSSDDKSDKNKILRKVFGDVEITLIQSGRGRIPAKYDIRAFIDEDLLRGDFLVL